MFRDQMTLERELAAAVERAEKAEAAHARTQGWLDEFQGSTAAATVEVLKERARATAAEAERDTLQKVLEASHAGGVAIAAERDGLQRHVEASKALSFQLAEVSDHAVGVLDAARTLARVVQSAPTVTAASDPIGVATMALVQAVNDTAAVGISTWADEQRKLTREMRSERDAARAALADVDALVGAPGNDETAGAPRVMGTVECTRLVVEAWRETERELIAARAGRAEAPVAPGDTLVSYRPEASHYGECVKVTSIDRNWVHGLQRDGSSTSVSLAYVGVWWRVERAAPAQPVPRTCCGRCDRCGWHLQGFLSEGCTVGYCSQRPLPPLRTHCAGCGAAYEVARG